MSLQHACVAALLVLTGCAKVEGAGDVCGAALVLTTRVNQQQRLAVNSPGVWNSRETWGWVSEERYGLRHPWVDAVGPVRVGFGVGAAAPEGRDGCLHCCLVLSWPAVIGPNVSIHPFPRTLSSCLHSLAEGPLLRLVVPGSGSMSGRLPHCRQNTTPLACPPP